MPKIKKIATPKRKPVKNKPRKIKIQKLNKKTQSKKIKVIKARAIKKIPEIKKREIKPPAIIVKEVKPKNITYDFELPKLVDIPYNDAPINRSMIRKNKARISPYLLDLKQIQTESVTENYKKNEKTIYEDIVNSWENKQGKFVNNLKFAYQKIRLKKSHNKIPLTNDSSPQINLDLGEQNLNNFLLETPKIYRFRDGWENITASLSNFKLPEIKIGSLIFPSAWYKALFAFIFTCLIFILPFGLYANYQKLQGKKDDILQKVSEAALHLVTIQKAVSAQDIYYTQLELQQTAINFNQAQQELDEINVLTKTLLKITPEINKKYITAEKMLGIGEKLSASAATLAEFLNQLQLDKSADNLNLLENLIRFTDALNAVAPDIKSTNDDLQDIYLEEIPTAYRSPLEKLKISLPLLEKNIDDFLSVSKLLENILGQDGKKRYLLVFQNNNEIRPTGGFIGSYALVDIDHGKIEKIDIPGGGPYDLKAGLKINLESPRPLHLMNPRWEFQDGNWFADLPTSAEKLMYLYEKSGGPTVDGLIFINATFVETALKIIGPISLPKYNLTIGPDNFFDSIQENVEIDYDKTENKPKQIIADLTPLIINRLLQSNPKEFLNIINLFFTSLTEKEIQIYFTNYSWEKFVLDNNWGGQIKNADYDYLDITSTNIAGEKTDAKIQQKADLLVSVEPDGSITNTLTITKTHLGIIGQPFYGVPNVDYLRIYVPKGSELLEAQGFDPMPEEFFMLADPEIFQKDPDLLLMESTKKIDQASQTEILNEANKTVFANWLRVEPGQTKTITVKYKLPFKITTESENINDLNPLQLLENKLNIGSENNDQIYSLLWQKQSGKRNFDINLQINFPKDLNYKFIYPNNLEKNKNNFTFSDKLNSDKFIAIIFNP